MKTAPAISRRRRALSWIVALALALSPLLATAAWAGMAKGSDGKVPVCTAQGIVWFDPAAPTNTPPAPSKAGPSIWCPLCPVAAAAMAPPPLLGISLGDVSRIVDRAIVPDTRVTGPRFTAAPRASRAPPVHA